MLSYRLALTSNHVHKAQQQRRQIISSMGMVFGRMGGIEEPAFSVLLDRQGAALPYEIREYGTRFAIETYFGTDNADRPPFMKLAGFIGVGSAPKNDGGRAIAMTAPVAMQRDHSGGQKISMTAPVVMEGEGGTDSGAPRKMQFILPREFDAMDKIPKPSDPDVTVVEIPPSRGAVHRYSGRFSEKDARVKAEKLVAQLKADGLEKFDEKKALDTHQFWGFNPPFTLPAFRRNEVWIELSKEDAKNLEAKVGANE